MYILAIDQGTSSTKTIIFDSNGKAQCKATEPLNTHYLKNNKVEQEPEVIYQNVLSSVKKCLANFNKIGGDLIKIKTCAISNQRETFVLWDKNGKPLYNAVVWQCKRSIDICDRLKNEGFSSKINEKTGLIIDPYFSGTKVIWLYENEMKIKTAIDNGEAYFGNIDSWLLFKLTNGEQYFTDYTNASRTMFFNLKELSWDKELLSDFGLANLNLPELKPSSYHYGETNLDGLLDHKISISALIGDSHAAAFGEGCFESGDAKATLGTGSSILMNIGNHPKTSKNGMVTTICWSKEGRVDYAFEGIIVSAGATIEWVKNQLELFDNVDELENICLSLKDNGGVYIIPAFSGLGAPHWDMNRQASIEGLSFDSNKKHIIRAAVESIPYQIKDVIVAMENDSGSSLSELKIDGGITSNKFVVQFLADLLKRKVTNIEIVDVSALGAAYLGGLNAGIYKSIEQLKSFNNNSKTTLASNNTFKLETYYNQWKEFIR
ncbi:carbohydrate kinase [Polaribacter reichenbachii]|uniref:ATP:glycerol 3-phosphotransferase n=1 Tax=Polaribacter reichenbachii TaxID=996801 RepID=A0A1B8TNJ7_9FLAO|nr:glycerol kinase GlpK [Polaribacter reichenbachii]APZ46677.1 carbohydrate kinase [Polaribacter reichenbachii]AUC17320.1 carbohydrate kinase [Polaribacter reichenbachii]OBY61231.1 carbohydrate kinase [Polaribacter reichenbachii]